MLRIFTAGECHGSAGVTIVEGMPAGVRVRVEDIEQYLKRWRSGAGRAGRGLIEADEAEIISGVRYGKTLSSPITLIAKHLDFAKWQDEMRIEETSKEVPKMTIPQPGHADLAGILKYGQDDIRNVRERATSRETIERVIAGAVIRQMLLEFGIRIASHTIQIGPVRLPPNYPYDFEKVASVFETSRSTRCIDRKTSQKMQQIILKARTKKDSLGGVVEIIATGVPVGLGSCMHYDRRLDGMIAQALMSIQSVKAVEIGNAIQGAAMFGSELQDAIAYDGHRFIRESNNMGGIEGGMSNGEDIICRVYHKPISTLGLVKTVDIATHQSLSTTVERSDICTVPRAGAVSEAMLAVVLGQAMIEKFGGDHIDEMKRNFSSYISYIQSR